ncbi:triose-phosphate isomerase [Sphingomonas bacterium]|uniref:triose-phosphate isomerase n=1 Tax=Sphingomonas bacterium TaxID=1895847 RepID=UPI0015774841|nr:triose-phosphate isomerase [Sphingomonas bacterium]
MAAADLFGGRSRRLVGTSWKMNKLRADADAFCTTLVADGAALASRVDLFVVPPFTLIERVAAALGRTGIAVGAQNVHWDDAGAWTGEISAPQAGDAGASFVEIGHSERRANFAETDGTVARKVAAVARNGLGALVCIGDTADEHRAGRSADVLADQVDAALSLAAAADPAAIAFAYEPVWAIGEHGTPADPAFANDMIAGIAARAGARLGREVSVLYGGSVHRDNAAALAAQPDIDGLFIGRSAWDAAGLLAIAHLFADVRDR